MGEMLLQALPENPQQGHAAEQIWSGEIGWRNLDQSKRLNTLHSIIISNIVDDQQEVRAENWPNKLQKYLMPIDVVAKVGNLKYSRMGSFSTKPR